MKINPVQLINFKSNVDVASQPQISAVTTNPIQKTQELQDVTPSYNIKTPTKYASLGTVDLPCSTKASMYKLENGQKVVIIPKKGPTVVKTYVNVGSMNEPDKVRGISHFIEHNLFNGSDGLKPGEFFSTVNKMGASTNASTGFAATDYYIESNLLKKNDLETEIKIHASMIETPKFTNEMIEKEKGPVTSEINMILDDSNNVATNNTIKLLYNINSTSKDVIGGTVDNINKVTREDLVDYYQKNYSPANMVTVITGEVEPEKTMTLISKYFGSKNTNPKPRNFEKLTPIQSSVRNDLISDKTTATVVSMGFNGPKNNDTKNKIILDAVQLFLVGSNVARLNKSLERIQINASMYSDRVSTKPEDGMVILLSTETSEENSENAINTVFEEIKNIEKTPPTEDEMNIIKKKLKISLSQVFESSEAINTVVGTSMLDNDLQSVTQFEKVIDGLTSKDIVDFSKKFFDLNKVAMTVIHPASADSKSINENYKKNNAVSFTGNPDEINHKEALDLNKMKRYQVANNLMVVTNDEKKNLAVFDLSISTAAPANVKPGVSHLLSIMLNRGSAFQDEKKFFANLENKGIETTFDASRGDIYIASTFLPTDSVTALKSAKEVLLNPRLTEQDFAEAKKILKEDLQNESKSANSGLMREMFKNQYYGISSDDVLKNIDNLQLEDVKGLYKYIMANAQAQIAISGPIESTPGLKNEIFKELSTDFPTFKTFKPVLFNSYIPIKEKNIVLQENSKSQAEIQMGYKFKTNNNLKDSITLNLMNIILGGTPSSRLFSDLREQQKLAYQVKSKINHFDNSGIISLFIKTTTDDSQSEVKSYDNVQKSIDGFNKHIQKLKTEKVSEEELENAKLNLKNIILNGSELTSDKNEVILSGLKSAYGVSKNNQILDEIDKITVDDIQTAANYVFKDPATISITATKNTLENNKNYLKTQGNIIA